MSQIKINLNDQQQQIIKSTSNIFVRAGAGTGKTRTIVELYYSLLNDKHYDVRNILAITFTDKAAKEMKERIMKKIEEAIREQDDSLYLKHLRNKMNYAWISTMHGFCARILREFPLEAGIDPMFEIVDEGEKKKRIKYCIRNYFNQIEGNSHFEKLRDLAMIYRYDRMLLLFEEALVKKQYDLQTLSDNFIVKSADKVTGERLKKTLPVFKEAFNEILEMYNRENKRENKYDYNQLLSETNRILKTNEPLRTKLQNRFKCIIMDEFQDTNEQQKEIVDALKGSDKTVFVGDAKQSIYLFNGADVSVFNKTQNEFQENESFELFQNYRSNKRLIEFFNLFFSRIFKKDEGKLFTVSYDNLSGENDLILENPVKLLPIVSNFYEECEQISSYILSEIKKGKSFTDFVILLRRMTKVETLETALRNNNIPYFIIGSRGFFNAPEIISLKTFIKTIYNPGDEENLLTLLRSFLSPFSDSELIEMRLLDKKSLFSALELYSKQNPSKSYFYEAIIAFRRKMNLISPAKIVKDIISVFNYEFLISQTDNAEKRLLNVKKFIEFSESVEGNLSLRNFIQKIDNAQTSTESEASADTENSNVVRVMTIHKSKGLEFPVVIVPELGYVKSVISNPYILTDYDTSRISLRDPEDKSDSGSEYMKMLAYEKEKESEEEKRVLYVAFTRAEKELVLSYSEPGRMKKSAVYRKALIDGKILKEKGSDIFWNTEDEEINIFTDKISEEVVSSSTRSNPAEKKQKVLMSESELVIPNTVYDLKNKPWKKYLSPTILTNNIQDAVLIGESNLFDGSEYDEKKNYTEDAESASRKQLGIAVHKVLEELGNLKMKDFNDEIIDQLLEKNPQNRDLLPSVKVIFRKLKEHRNRQLAELEISKEIYSEIPIRKKFDQYILTGTIDKLYKNEREWQIMDFKFASYSKVHLEKYKFQIQFYLYCLQNLCSPRPQRGFIYFLKDNQVFEVVYDKYFEKRLKAKIEEFNEASGI